VLGLIDDLLSYARVEAGEEVVRAEAVLLVHVVEQSLVLVRPLADSKGLQIRAQGHSAPIELHTDPRKLRQILVNVLANAVKFTDTGDVSLLSRVEGEAEDAIVTICFEVTDTGRGMSLADQEHTFEPFWQADPA
jgi:signal transduction histidine kinase